MPLPRTALARRATLGLLLGLALGALAAAPAAAQAEAPVQLFRIQLARGEVTIGLTPAELAGLGAGPEVSRIARRIAERGELTAWRYVVTRAPDGSTRLAARDRVAVMRQDALLVEPYRAALPVAAPPTE
jgi:ABC-type sugar transport system substrate-binding protein